MLSPDGNRKEGGRGEDEEEEEEGGESLVFTENASSHLTGVSRINMRVRVCDRREERTMFSLPAVVEDTECLHLLEITACLSIFLSVRTNALCSRIPPQV